MKYLYNMYFSEEFFATLINLDLLEIIYFNPLNANFLYTGLTPWSLRTSITPDTVKIMKKL